MITITISMCLIIVVLFAIFVLFCVFIFAAIYGPETYRAIDDMIAKIIRGDQQ